MEKPRLKKQRWPGWRWTGARSSQITRTIVVCVCGTDASPPRCEINKGDPGHHSRRSRAAHVSQSAVSTERLSWFHSFLKGHAPPAALYLSSSTDSGWHTSTCWEPSPSGSAKHRLFRAPAVHHFICSCLSMPQRKRIAFSRAVLINEARRRQARVLEISTPNRLSRICAESPSSIFGDCKTGVCFRTQHPLV